ATRLRVTSVLGPGRSEAVVPAQAALPRAGALAEIVVWSAEPGTPLGVWISETADGAEAAIAFAAGLAREASRRGVRWIADPTVETPAHVLRWRDQGWELAGADGRRERLGPAPDATAVLAKVSRSLFVQIPVPAAAVRSLELGPAGIEPVADPGAADYVLAG